MRFLRIHRNNSPQFFNDFTFLDKCFRKKNHCAGRCFPIERFIPIQDSRKYVQKRGKYNAPKDIVNLE